jgi:adenylate cyclase
MFLSIKLAFCTTLARYPSLFHEMSYICNHQPECPGRHHSCIMPYEIERKFLVKGSFEEQAFKKSHIRQGYLATGRSATVRVRTKGDKGFLTIKGKSDPGGITRYEWEKEIPLKDAEELLELCTEGLIDKIRHEIRIGAHVFEVDVFHGLNEGLIVAEVELGDESEAFERPSWLGTEVTGDRKYNNSQLVKRPFSEWNSSEKY